MGPCPEGSCVFVADIGDNAARRSSVTIYRIPEPAASEASAAVSAAFTLSYPDGAHDAEALLVTKDGVILIVTKGETGPVNVYRVPASAASGGGRVTLERVGASIKARAAADERITDGSVSPDGQWIALRSHSTTSSSNTRLPQG